MFKPNKSEIKTLGLILILIISSAYGGYLIAWATNGSNLTIDEAKGIYNAPWFNATVGVKAPRIEIEEFYLNSVDKGDVLNYPDLDAKFVVCNINNIAYLKNLRTGKIDWSSTDHDSIINAAIGNLTLERTWQEKIYIIGYFTIDNPIIVYDYTILVFIGEITLATNSNCNMIQNADTTNGNGAVLIVGANLDGNSLNQNGAGPYYGISWRGTIGKIPEPQSVTFPGRYNFKLDTVGIKSTKGSAVLLANMSLFVFNNFRCSTGTQYAASSGLELISVSDSWFTDGRTAGNKYAAYFYYGTANHFENYYFAGTNTDDGVYCNGINRYIFTNCRVDAFRKHGFHLMGYYGCDDNTWSGCQITNTGSYLITNNTYSGWYFTGGGGGNSSGNSITGGGVYHWSSITNGFKYGIEEALGLVDHNIYVGIILIDPYSDGVLLSPGSQSESAHNQT